ncbi:MAG: hypothetical protein ACR2KL_14370 [Nocardioidaceae bacterium]
MFDLSFRIADRFRPFELVAPGFVQVDEPAPAGLSGRVRTDQAPAAPFAAVELEVQELSGAGVAVGLSTADDEHVLVGYDPGRGRVTIEVRSAGRTRVVKRRKLDLVAPLRLGFVLCENQVTGVADSGHGWQPLLTMRDRVAQLVDLRDPATLARYAFSYGPRREGDPVHLGRVRAGAFGYTGLRDPHLVQHPDGRAYVKDGRAYLTFTCAGMGFFQQAHWGVFTLDLADPTSVRQVAQLYTARNGLVLGDHAGQLVIDEDSGRSLVGVSSWGDFDFNGVHVRHLTTSEDLLSGVHLMATEELELPTPVSSWDPSFTRVDDRWHVAFVESPSQDPFDFHPALAVGAPGGDYDKGLKRVGSDDTVHECEGPIIQQLEGTWYLLASNKDSREYPVYDLGMRRLGTLDAPYLTNIPHPQIVDLPGGGQLMVTFDGKPYGQRVLGYGTHGDVVVMRPS